MTAAQWRNGGPAQFPRRAIPPAPPAPPPPPARPSRTYLTPEECAAELRVSKMTVYREIHAGRLAAVRVGRGFRILEAALDRYIAEQDTLARIERGEEP